MGICPRGVGQSVTVCVFKALHDVKSSVLILQGQKIHPC
jgi:hypothetical protein